MGKTPDKHRKIKFKHLKHETEEKGTSLTKKLSEFAFLQCR